MTWNYRIIKHRGRNQGHGEIWFGLHEVYYNKKGKIYLWDETADIVGESAYDIVRTLAVMIRDSTRNLPILDAKRMPGKPSDGAKTKNRKAR